LQEEEPEPEEIDTHCSQTTGKTGSQSNQIKAD